MAAKYARAPLLDVVAFWFLLRWLLTADRKGHGWLEQAVERSGQDWPSLYIQPGG